MSMVLLLIGAGLGLTLGLTGAGGSVLGVPLLVLLLGWSLTQAMQSALFLVWVAASWGSFQAWRQGLLRYRAALWMSVSALISAPLGVFCAQHLPVQVLQAGFALVMLVVALRMYWQARHTPADSQTLRVHLWAHLDQQQRFIWTRRSKTLMLSIGLCSGFLSGLLGVGGGFVIVPLLRQFTPLSMPAAVATSLLAISLSSAISLGSQALLWSNVPNGSSMQLAVGAILGMMLGQKIAHHVSGSLLQQGFAVLMLLVSVYFFSGAL